MKFILPPAYLLLLATSLLIPGPFDLTADTLSATAGVNAVWSTNSNWADNSFPVAADDVLIDYSSNNSVTTVLGLNAAQAANSLAFGSATGNPLGSFTLRANTSGTTGRTLTLTSGSITVDSSVTGAINLGTPSTSGFGLLTVAMGTTQSTITVASGKTLNIDAVFTGTASGNLLTFAGGGTVALNANNGSFGASGRLITTSSIAGSVLAINNAGALGNTGNILVLTAGSTIDNTSAGAITLNNANTVRVNGNFTYTGTQNLTFNGIADLRGGTRTISTTAGVLAFNGNNATVDASALIKQGNGALILGGSNAYTGNTTVSAGKLVVNNSAGSATGTGAMTVGASGTLAGTGLIEPGLDRSVTLNGTLEVGDLNSVTATDLNITTSGTGAFSIGAGSFVNLDLFTNDIAGADKLITAGTVTIAGTGTRTLNVFNTGALTFSGGNSFDLFDWGATPTGNFNTVNLPTLTGDLSWNTSALYSTGIISVVPEPSALLLGLGAVALLVASKRRRSV